MPTLKLQILAARNVPEGEYICKIVCGKEKGKTKTSKKTSSPDWSDTFTFTIESPNVSLNIELEQTKKFGKKSFGILTIDLSNFIKGKERVWWIGDGFQDGAELRLSLTAVDFGKEEPKNLVSNQQSLLPPMPSAEEVERRYAEVMETIGLGKDFKHPTEYQTKAITGVSLENKWAMVCQHQKVDAAQKLGGRIEDTPQYWTSKIKAEPTLKLIKELQIVLGGANLQWLKSFIDAGGLSNLLDILGTVEMDIHRKTISSNFGSLDEQVNMQSDLVLCLQRLMNNKTGLQGTINTEGGVKKLALCIDMAENMRIKVVQLLTVVCLVPPDGHRLTVEGLTSYKAIKKEKRRFETIIKYLSEAKNSKEKTIYLSFINALINSPTDIDVRIAIREEFVNLGLVDILKNLKSSLNPQTDTDLETQIDVYEEESNDDYKELHDRFAALELNIDDIDDVIKHLKESMKNAGLGQNFLGLLQNIVLMPINNETGIKSFLLACRIVRQISLNKERVGTSEEFQVNLADLLTSVQNEANEIPLHKKIEDLENELNIFHKKCTTLEIEIKEKDEQIQKLKVDVAQAAAAAQAAATSGNVINAPQGSVVSQDPGLQGSEAPSPPPIPGNPPLPPILGNAPPPPPIPGGPPLPPPPGGIKIVKKKPKSVPKQKMKGLQWVKLPQNKLTGSVFEKMELEYKGFKFNYSEIEEYFSAKVIEKKEEKKEEKIQPVQILDPKTSQNLSIFLSQFKSIPFPDLCKGIQYLNQKMFTSEQVKQIASFLPSKDDIISIQQFLQGGGDPNRLPAAEKFALELDKVPQLEQRVSAFDFKVSFDLRKADIKPGIEALRQGCKEVLECKRLPILLEVVLELGNFLNEGTPRGGVFGFKIGSLLKIADTKSTDNATTLVQYLVKMLEKNSPDLLKIQSDFPTIEAAAKVSLPNLQSDMALLVKDLNNVENMLNTTFGDVKDKFVEIMTSFISKVKSDVETIQTSFKLMEDKYRDLCLYLGEDPKTTQPDELFGTLVSFIHNIQDAVKANQQAVINAEKNARREDARIKRQAELDKKKQGSDARDDVVEELFGALQGGNLFKNRRLTQQQSRLPMKGASPPTKAVFPGPGILKPAGMRNNASPM